MLALLIEMDEEFMDFDHDENILHNINADTDDDIPPNIEWIINTIQELLLS